MTIKRLFEDSFADSTHWLPETSGDLAIGDGAFRWDCEGAGRMGTVWCTTRFDGPLEVSYQVTCMAGANNLNFILCADMPDGDLLGSTDERTGIYAEYQTFPNYIVTYLTDPEGRSRIRFRRNPGFELLDEAFDDMPIEQGEPISLAYRIDGDGVLSISRQGRELFRVQDSQPLPLSGYLGFRTWNSHVVYGDFCVSRH